MPALSEEIAVGDTCEDDDELLHIDLLEFLQAVTDTDFYPRNEQQEALGRLLFHDKIVSGNRNISCASCHHILTGTSDGLSLSIGEGGHGLSVTRDTGTGEHAVHERVPRNSPALFNLGAVEFQRMFHDGRVEIDSSQPSGFRSPAGDQLPGGLDNPLAVQAMFPVTSTTEMAGQASENEIAVRASLGDLVGVWERLADRLRANQQYAEMFVDAFEDIDSAADIEFHHAANAIAAYEAAAWRADESPFDRWLRGERDAISLQARRGAELFYGRANCGSYHSGRFQTDHEFHAAGVPQIGPGKGDNAPGYADGRDDFGRERVTGEESDRYCFRTPSLRNVALTGPWGHSGAYNDLKATVRHMSDPATHLNAYDPAQCVLPSRQDLDAQDLVVHGDSARRAQIQSRIQNTPVMLTDTEVEEILDFLHALTDPRSLDLRHDMPRLVPSGLPLDD
ncbi:MAG: cytochrome-c peroxidase [Acidobacteriota bacterium]|nr:MAG: cytochrome-c peroxidase [Acidobacteriota bacterium]